MSIEAKFLRVMAVAMKIGVEEIFAEFIAALPDTFEKGENKSLLKRLGSGLNHLLLLFNDDTKRLDLPKKNTKLSTEDMKKGEKQEDSNLDKKRVFCAVRRPPDFTVGFDKPMMELKTLLLKEEVHQLLLTAPAGCGKTTLVQMLCQDKQIKGTPLSLGIRAQNF